MRRKLAVLAAAASAIALFMAMATVALANEGPHGGYQVGGQGKSTQAGTQTGWNSTDACSACHRAHTASNEFLLPESDVTDLCKDCHSNRAGAITDVFQGQDLATVGSPAPLNGGGFVQAYNWASGSWGNVTSSHAVKGVTNAVYPGGATGNGMVFGGGNPATTIGGTLAQNSADGGLECTSCHNPHGSGNYRILSGKMSTTNHSSYFPATWLVGDATWGTSNVGATAADLNATMTGSLSGGSAISTHSYAAGNNVVYDRGMSDFCATCHTNYVRDFAGSRTAFYDPVAATTVNPTGEPMVPYQWATSVTAGSNVFRHAVSYKAAWNYTTNSWDTTTWWNKDGSAGLIQHGPNWSTPQAFGLREVAGDLGLTLYSAAADPTNGTAVNSYPTAYTSTTGPTTVSVSHDNNGGNLTCLTCHNAHGSSAKDASWTAVGGQPELTGGSALLYLDNRGVCQTCHNKGFGN